MTTRPITILIVDDNVTLRTGLEALFASFDDLRVVGVAGDGARAVEQVVRLRPDVTLMDVRMPGTDGLSAAAAVADRTRVIMLTSTEDVPTVERALQLGIAGYLVHGSFQARDLPDIVRDTVAGRAHMTSGPTAIALQAAGGARPSRLSLASQCGMSRREVEVMDAIASGMPNGDIAAALFLSPKTVKNHVNRIFAKLGAANRGQAIALWLGSSPRPATGPAAGSAVGPALANELDGGVDGIEPGRLGPRALLS